MARHVLELECEVHQAKEALLAILHTIIFTRSIGCLRPKEVDLELFDITFCKVNDAGIDGLLEARATELSCALAARGRGTVCIDFPESGKQDHRRGWFGGGMAESIWESWVIHVRRGSPGPEMLREKLGLVLRLAHEHRDAIPAMQPGAPESVPDVRVLAPSDSANWISLDGILKRVTGVGV
eukprot:tig00000448_g867.t1